MNIVETAGVLKSGDWVALVLLALVAVPVVARGLFALASGRHRRRAEFLELWKNLGMRDDATWLEEVIRHRYGGALPASVIRHVLPLVHPSEKLRRLAMVSGFFAVDPQRLALAWKRSHRNQLFTFSAEVLAFGAGYVALAFVGGMFLLYGWRTTSTQAALPIVGGLTSVVLALRALFHSMALVDARSVLQFVNEGSGDRTLTPPQKRRGRKRSA